MSGVRPFASLELTGAPEAARSAPGLNFITCYRFIILFGIDFVCFRASVRQFPPTPADLSAFAHHASNGQFPKESAVAPRLQSTKDRSKFQKNQHKSPTF